ncbi:acyl carrier protein [Neogemmobacter tilapiae]|uniref:Phosphopantetheine-binding protein n=1 Tax=Neogemmobacter tilapiae TaxID=875041 RepID=A0A918TFU6_9RHOB|nr:phosphopantetheine-binding protein [Gemmobacter tilapiae]GHC44933.1 phosphopantetheine-binding protein [Gemmobacter tilapiae]
MADVTQRIREIIAEQALRQPDEIALDAGLGDLGIDSLGLVEAIFAIEETFNIAVPFNANEPGKSDFDFSSVGAIVRAVEGLIAARAA